MPSALCQIWFDFVPRNKFLGYFHIVSSALIKLVSIFLEIKHLIRSGNSHQFGKIENYNNVVQDDKEFERIVWYILNNPVKAGLVDAWEKRGWTYCKWM